MVSLVVSAKMGALSFRSKSYFLDLLKCLNSLNWYIILFSLINLSVCIYEDQIGKFDWRQTYVGRIKFAQFDTVSTAKKIIVATEENVLAALHLKTGQVVWRHVLESASSGNVQLLHVSEKVLTVSGSNPYMVRGWDTATGVMLWEWSLSLHTESPELSEWWVKDAVLVHMLPIYGSHVEVTIYNVLTGQNRGSTSKLPAVWSNDECVVSPPYYTCLSRNKGNQLLLSMDVTSDAVSLISKPLSNYLDSESSEAILTPLDGNSVLPGFILDNKKVLLIKGGDFEEMKVSLMDAASVTIVDSTTGPLMLQSWQDEDVGFALTAHSVATYREVPDVRALDQTLRILEPELSAAVCTRSSREQHVCRVLVTGADDASHLMQQGGKVLWTREEALANVVAVEFVDLPVSDLEAAIESEFDQKEGSIWAAFSRRVHTQALQLQALVQSWLTQETGHQDAASPLVRDYFNLHKIMVMVTETGKIFGMDNLSGEIIWHRFEPYLDSERVLMYLRRSARHPPLDAYLTIIGRHEVSGNGVLISLNPITGAPVGERTLHLDTKLLQAALLHQPDEEKLHAVVVLDNDENVQVFPQSSSRLVVNLYMYVADPDTAQVQGYALKFDGKSVNAHKTWSIYLGGSARSGHRIVRALAKPDERVHSQGRVLGDRSVLYKYLNPNLVLFITQGPDAVHKDIVVASCVDVVSGAVVHAQAHRRARASPYAVHSENFLAYVYYSDKHRRTEIATLELYEGPQRWLPAGAAFSSHGSELGPSVERQSYIVSASVAAAAVTRTERALTDKHVLLALTTGTIVEMPWAYLDPRRPVTPTAEQREEGLVPYSPELPLPAEASLNYNRTVARVRSIYTAPGGLESTCLVLASGLDLFYTRVAPSKTFDLLKEDFDYYLITLVLGALILATYSTKYFASRKMLRQAWK